MFVSLNWLKQYVDISDITTEDLAEKVTKSGIEVDGIHHIAEKSTNVVTGYVQSCEKHPDADKLNICQVDVGDETLQIVCGAPNIAAKQTVAVAKPGAVLPGNFKIKKAKLRGVESSGMICSLQELGIEAQYVPKEYETGIFVFPEETAIGEPVESFLNLDDAVLEFDLTPNRADCLNMIGVAYEVAAILDKPLNLPEVSVSWEDQETSELVQVKIEDTKLNPYYAAFIVENIEVKEAPLWMRNRLIAMGIRPINNVVDITNYVLLEYGQPLHAFDFDLVNSDEILIRRAQENEKLTTLDQQERELNTDNLVITNGKEPIALAGVMGGHDTEVNENTKRILLEAAYFDGFSIRKTVKQTGLRSEASTRYEKGIDPSRVYAAGLRACQLLEQYANATILKNPVIVDELNTDEHVLKIDAHEVNRRLGTNISTEEMGKIFTKLRFAFDVANDEFTIHIPTRRGDITIFEDILEEVARLFGYDHLPYTLPKGTAKGGLTERQRLKRYTKHFLEGAGLAETITYSLIDDAQIKQFISPDVQKQQPHPISLALPMTEEHKYLRLSLLPELLSVAAYNEARNIHDIALYEMGAVFISKEATLTTQPKEALRLSGVLAGHLIQHPWQQASVKIDFYVAKGIVESLFRYLDIEATFVQAEIDQMHPGRTATIKIGDDYVGYVGQVHPFDQKQLDLKETYVFDIDFEKVLELYDRVPQFNSIPKYPSISRDIAFIVNSDVHAGDIRDVIKSEGAPLVKSVDIFDVYEGEHLEDNQKSIAYHLLYQDPERTLTDDEVGASYEKIIAKVNEQFGAYVRS